jgi:uncharacterized protein (DUF924 family)
VTDKPTQFSPNEIVQFWFADAASDPARAAARNEFWFKSSSETDALIRERFSPAIEAAARGELAAWADAPRSALALVLLLDQFSRNIWRGTARAFAHDTQALTAAQHAVASEHLRELMPVEQAFLLLPYQHSESIENQRESVRLSDEITMAAPPAWRPLMEYYAKYAKQHRDLIERFGRFPHRNRVLGRESTAEEKAYLSTGGATFGQEG